MRILYFTTSYPPYISGVSIFAAHRVAAMHRAGHTVGLVRPALDEKVGVKTCHGIKEYVMRSWQNPFRIKHSFFIITPGEVKKIIEDFQPDIIHYNDPSLWPWVIGPWARKRGIKLVITLHALASYAMLYVPALQLFWPIFIWYWQLVLRQFDLISVPSKVMLDDVIRNLQLPDVPVVEISNGVDSDLFQPKQRQSVIKHKPLQFLYVGRLDFEKGLAILIAALREVPGKWHLTLVGGGKCEAELKQQVVTAGLKDKVSFMGQRPETELPAFYQAADVFVIPSLNDSQSIVTLQALASGLPVIASNCTAFPEIVHPGKNGWLFTVGSVTALRKTLQDCLKHPEKLAEYGKVSLQLAQQHSLKHVDGLWLQTYQQLLKSES